MLLDQKAAWFVRVMPSYRREKRFGVEPEITCKLARMHVRFYEVSISYDGRTYAEGKKIRAKDGFRALYCIFRYGLFGRKSFFRHN